MLCPPQATSKCSGSNYIFWQQLNLLTFRLTIEQFPFRLTMPQKLMAMIPEYANLQTCLDVPNLSRCIF